MSKKPSNSIFRQTIITQYPKLHNHTLILPMYAHATLSNPSPIQNRKKENQSSKIQKLSHRFKTLHPNEPFPIKAAFPPTAFTTYQKAVAKIIPITARRQHFLIIINRRLPRPTPRGKKEQQPAPNRFSRQEKKKPDLACMQGGIYRKKIAGRAREDESQRA